MASGRARRGGAAIVVVLGLVAAAAIGGRALWNAAQKAVQPAGCDFGSYRLDLDRAQDAAEVVSVVISRKLSERAAVLVLAAALQESKLDNIPSGQGDRDSVGILQQRPSQGWGTAAQLSDVRYATGRFLDAVVKVPNWQNDSLAIVIQTVQVSADGSAYARHEPEAQQLADSLMGVQAAGVSCDFDKPTTVAASSAVAARVSTDLPISTPSVSPTAVSVPGAGWPTAVWFVAHGNEFGIDRVSFAGKYWQRSKGWHDDARITGGAVTATLGKL